MPNHSEDLQRSFIRMSQYAGNRFDLTQANGGNTSVKINDVIYIKSSGCYLSDVGESTGFSIVKLSPLFDLLRSIDTLTSTQLKNIVKSNIIQGCYPSIEITMHAQLGTFVLHTHPLAVNALTAHQHWRQRLQPLFPEAIFIDYATPSRELAIKVRNTLNEKNVDIQKTLIIFLQNHGLVISASDADTAILETERVIKKIEREFDLRFEKYKIAEKLYRLISSISASYSFCYTCCDQELLDLCCSHHKSLFFKGYCIPSAFVYNTLAVEINDLEDTAAIHAYIKHYGKTPQVILYQQKIYLLAANIQKALELESTLKEHLLLHRMLGQQVRVLTIEELKALQEELSS